MRKSAEKFNTTRLRRSAFAAVMMCLILLSVLSAATFAWFSSNHMVGTSRVTGRIAAENAELLLSSTGGAAFRGSGEADIIQTNSADCEFLTPVSTADLVNFVSSTAVGEGYASYFTPVKNESGYFRGRVYVMAKVTGGAENASVALYLDESEQAGGAIVREDGEDGLILSAARLGLIFDDDPGTAVILRLSEDGADGRAMNTMLDGAVMEEGSVLDSSGDELKAVPDPSVPIGDYTVSDDEGFPRQPIFTAPANRIIPVDVYFYLEGCDPDCTEAIAFDGSELHLAFYGVLS
ncbi:MAG: hypothetical protein J5827_04690 [Oscillospiraceae bacterium]|nr:hypothetical protein [Oscillospiraceae bacterium]